MTVISPHTQDGPLPAAAVPKRPRFLGVRIVMALVLREMTTTYGRSLGGYFWAVAQPVAIIVMLSVAFSILLRAPSLGTSFMYFYAGGILPLRMFQQVVGAVGGSLQFNKALLTYPRVTFMDSIIARAILAIVTQIMVVGVVLGGIYAFEGVREIINFGPIVLAFLMAALLGVGIGTFNTFMITISPLYGTAWQTVNRPLLLVSGVFYIYEDLPPPAQDILWWNPLIHLTGLARVGLFSTYSPQYITLTYVALLSVIPFVIGLLLLRRYNRVILYL